MRSLHERNLHSTQPVVAAGGPVVSLTSYGRRLASVFYTLESIGAGQLLPSRLVLWVDASLLQHELPAALQRLMRRGLEVRGTRDVGPHTKYFPQVMSEPHAQAPLVTADDDILYPTHWLEELARAASWRPELIHCFRAHVIRLDYQGQLAPYATWPRCHSTQPSHLHFATGVAGVIYPPAMQAALRSEGDRFARCCPKADDIWINVTALRRRIQVRQIVPLGARFYELPGTRTGALARDNVQGGGNDRQLAATYGSDDLKMLKTSDWLLVNSA
ncbi:MAG: hypothetical protein QM718_09085 [Steroidobacteraceae bacterium]